MQDTRAIREAPNDFLYFSSQGTHLARGLLFQHTTLGVAQAQDRARGEREVSGLPPSEGGLEEHLSLLVYLHNKRLAREQQERDEGG